MNTTIEDPTSEASGAGVREKTKKNVLHNAVMNFLGSAASLTPKQVASGTDVLMDIFRSEIKQALERLEAEKEHELFKKNPKTGDYNWGDAPSSVCRDCGQRRKAEEQGKNAGLEQAKQILSDLIK